MSDLFFSTRSFHCLWLPLPNLLPPKPLSQTLPFSPSFPFPRSRFTFTSTHHTHILPNSTSSSTPIPQEDEELHVISSTQCSDGSFVFRFGNASEIREMIAELNQQKLVEENVEEVGISALVSDGVEKLSNEDDGNLGEEIESSSTVVVAVADQNPHLFVSEKESVVVLDSDLVTPVINDLQKIDGHLKLDSVEDGDYQNGICSEDVAEPSVVPSVSKEDTRVDSYKEVVVSTVSPESDVFSDLSSGASMEVEEKEEVDNSRGVDRAANSSAGGVDVADLTELVQVSTSLESDISIITRTNNLPGSVDADKSELEPLSTSLESEQDDYSATDNLTGSVDNGVAELVPVSTSSESEQVAYSATDNLTNSVDTDISELAPVSTSLESEQVDYSATDNLAGSVDADVNEPVSVSTYLESEQVDYSATDNLTGSVDAELSELMPVSSSLESEEVDYNATDNLAGSVDASVSELVPVSTSLESEQVDYSEKDNLTGRVDDSISESVPVSVSLDSAINNLIDGVDAKVSEPVPISTSLEPEQVDYSATDNMTDSVDADISKLEPVSTSLDSEQVKYSAADGDLAPSVDDSISELVPVSTSLDSEQSVNGETNRLTDGVDSEFSEPVPISTSLEPEQVDYSSTDNMTDNVVAEISELVPTSTSLDSEQSVTSETNHLTAGVDAKLSKSVSISSLEPEQVDYSATDYLNGGVDADLSKSAPVSTSLGSELHADDDETSHHGVEDSVDASKTGKSAMLDDLVPFSDMENKIDVDNTKSSDEENPLLIIVPEVHPIEMASNAEQISRTELFLVSGAAILPHPSTALTSREDAYFISRQNWFVVADGVGQWSLEGSNTGVYIRELMEKCENIVSNYENISTIKPAEVLTRSAAETESPGSSSVLAAYFDGQALHAANVGNTGFIIIRDGSIFKISNAMFHEFSFPIHIVKDDDHSEIIQEYKIDLNDGDVIVFATNGLFDNLYEQEIASIISKSLQASLKPQEIAEILATRAQEVGKSRSSRSPFGDAAKALGYVGYAGGKLDDVTVIVSLVQTT